MVLLAKAKPARRDPKPFVEVIISRSCQGRTIDSTGIEHLELGRVVKVTEDEGRQLTLWAGAALYVSAEDDPTDDKFFTVNDARRAAINCELKQRKDREAQRAEDEAFARAQRLALIERYSTGQP